MVKYKRLTPSYMSFLHFRVKTMWDSYQPVCCWGDGRRRSSSSPATTGRRGRRICRIGCRTACAGRAASGGCRRRGRGSSWLALRSKGMKRRPRARCRAWGTWGGRGSGRGAIERCGAWRCRERGGFRWTGGRGGRAAIGNFLVFLLCGGGRGLKEGGTVTW